MASMLGKSIWAKRTKVGLWLKAGHVTPRRTRSAQRHAEKRLWTTRDQEMPYYWHPTADIQEDHEEGDA